MIFDYKKNKKLPPLAWIAEIPYGSDVVNVTCGVKVECHDSFCVSGVWEDDFLKGDIVNAISLQGTGLQMVMGGGNLLHARPFARVSVFHKGD